MIRLVLLGGILAMGTGVLCLAHADYGSGTELPGAVREPVASTDRPSIYTEPRTFRTPEDVALYGLIVIVGLAAFLPLVSRAVTQPAKVSIVPLARPYECVEDVSQEVRRSTQALMALGFVPQLDFTIPELPHRGFYRFMATANGHHTVLVAEVETQPRISKKKDKDHINFIEYQTVLDNGCRVNTSNNPMRNPLTPPPHFLVTQHPHTATPAALFDVHRRDLDEMRSKRGGRIWRQSLETFNEDFIAEWSDIMGYQAALGLLKLGKDGKTYHGRTALLLRAIAPPITDRPRPWLAPPIPIAGALLTGLIVWCVPKFVALTGIQSYPLAAKELEAYLVLIPPALAGYLVGMGGALLGVLCYAPTLVLFNAGPIDHAVLMLLALTAGSLGEKVRYWSTRTQSAFFKYFSPEIYVTVALLVAAGW